MASEPPGADLAEDADWELWAGGEEPHSLVELVNRVLDRGVVITGDITLSVAGVDLVYLGLSVVLTSVSSARRTLGRPVGTEPLEGAGDRGAG
jgi:gas vesicle structural protein